jgi:hypothetical protein
LEKVRARWLLVGACALLLGGCSNSHHGATVGSTTSTSAARQSTSGTVWLCRPGGAPDPCDAEVDATVVPAAGSRTVQLLRPAADPAFDCFYVYPTVSTEDADNADLTVQPAETAAAIAQAAPFSQVCRVWAPVYRQATLRSLLDGTATQRAVGDVAYRSLLAGWQDYLARDNDGRPVIFIGHSQGAAMLIRLLATQIDPNPALRRRVVSAILAGGNVTVPAGKVVGATFHALPLCAAARQTGCVIAYSTFPNQPPAAALFGRPGQGVSLMSGQTGTAGLQVACVNPAAMGGGTGPLTPYFPRSASLPPPPPVRTTWVTYPDLYTAGCQTGAGASWLQVSTVAGAIRGRPVVTEDLGPAWGYHVADVNLALGNLIQDVRLEEGAYHS